MKRESWITVLVYLIFNGLILAGCLITESAWPLLGLIFTPDVEVQYEGDKDQEEDK